MKSKRTYRLNQLTMTLLLSGTLLTSQSFAGPSGGSDKVITGIILGVTTAALLTAIAQADEVEIHQAAPKRYKYGAEPYRHQRPSHHQGGHFKPHHYKPHHWQHWNRHERPHWRSERFYREYR